MKEKKRYLAFEVISDSSIESYFSVFSAIKNGFSRFSGMKGVSQAGLLPLADDWDQKRRRGVFRVSAKSTQEARAVLALIKEIDGKQALVRSLGTSGMLKKVRERYLSS
ncbi:MAG: hypothetical protein GXP63_01360 [DPANN group archaeon]|nr:hypothetical protein [DPANN group archaeon]